MMVVVLYKYNDFIKIDINIKVGHPAVAGQGVGQAQ
jgi:hypothetical protein